MLNKKAGFVPLLAVIAISIISIGGYILVKDVATNIKLDFEKPSVTPAASSQTPQESALPTPHVSPTPKATKQASATKAPAPACVVVKTYGMFSNDPEFEAEKCYTKADASLLNDTIRKYNNASFNYNGAASKANVTCQGFTDSFKQMCEQSKSDVAKYQAEIDLYKAQLKAIIARGK